MAVIDGAGDLHRARVDRQRRSIRTGGDMERKGNMSGTDQHKRDEWPNLEADPHTGAGAKAPDGNDTDKAAGREDLTKQFQELGQRLAATARAAWQSEQRQELQQEIAEGLRTVRDQLNEAVGTVRSSQRAQDVTETVKTQVGKATDTVRANEIFDDLRSGVASGLRELNEQLRRLAERLEHRDDTTAATDTTTTASTASADPTPASTAATAPEIDQLLGSPDVVTAPSVEPTNDLPSKPEGPAGTGNA
jgi:ribosome-associated translation inhibitor RaiA